MKKSFLLIAILFLMFFINQSVVNASIDVNLCNSSGTCIGNTNTSPLIYPMGVSTSSFNYTVSGSTSNPEDGLRQGQRWRVMALYCSNYVAGEWRADYKSSVGVTINDSFVSTSPDVSCQHTNSNGEVMVGKPVRIITDFTITTSGVFYMRYYIGRYNDGQLSGSRLGFTTYTILDGASIQSNENTQNIINNDNSNTQDIINNQNANTDRIVNAQNGTTNAVNGLNDSINNTNTSGSENALSSIINDPAFQDNTGINSIITLPVNMISSLSNTCQPITINIPFINSNVQLPCFRAVITQHMPLVANLIGIVVNGFILYRILIDIVGIVKSARNPDEDRLDVLEL